MTWLSDSLPPGLDNARPAARAALVGAYYYATDTQRLYECVSSTAWTVVGIGTDKATMGAWTDSVYYNGAHTTGPLGAAGSYSWATNIYVESLPGTGGGLYWTNANTGISAGWSIGGSASASNKMRVLMAGLTPSGGSANIVELPGITLTTGPHTLAFCLKAGSTSVHYSWDGAIQTAITVSGTFAPAAASGSHYIGRWAAGSFAGSWASIAWLQAFNADLSDADLNTLSGSPTTYVPPAISTAPVFNWQSRWWLDGQPLTNPIGAQAGRLIGTNPSSIVKTGR